MEEIVEEKIEGVHIASLQVERPMLEEFGNLLAAQLETSDYEVRLTNPLRFDENSVVVPHLQIVSARSPTMPALVVDFFDSLSKNALPARLRLYEKHRLREYWSIDLEGRELDRYVLLEGFFLPAHSFDLRTDSVFSVVFPELRLDPTFSGWTKP